MQKLGAFEYDSWRTAVTANAVPLDVPARFKVVLAFGVSSRVTCGSFDCESRAFDSARRIAEQKPTAGVFVFNADAQTSVRVFPAWMQTAQGCAADSSF